MELAAIVHGELAVHPALGTVESRASLKKSNLVVSEPPIEQVTAAAGWATRFRRAPVAGPSRVIPTVPVI